MDRHLQGEDGRAKKKQGVRVPGINGQLIITKEGEEVVGLIFSLRLSVHLQFHLRT